ncbi:unnamed protein product [Brassica napus]|uniref:(rape) hypothetical protein n=1 Tax=Brassica napus TaxID=3708 RepID=A0A816JXZ7_BRANA|nr:unnamed protein product [Brassica napus]
MKKYEVAPVELLASKISVWWDITSCPVPKGYNPRLVHARMGKKIEEQELDDFNVEPVGIVCRHPLLA